MNDKLINIFKTKISNKWYLKLNFDQNTLKWSKNFIQYVKKLKNGEKVVIFAWIMYLWNFGKRLYLNVWDSTGTIQVSIAYNFFLHKFDHIKRSIAWGDHIIVTGIMQVYKDDNACRYTIQANHIWWSSKNIFPILKHHKLNEENKVLLWPLELILNDRLRRNFYHKSIIINSLWNTLIKKGYTEVFTPILQRIYGGANANPFCTYHKFLKEKLYLRIALELPLKKMIVSGYEKVFEIGQNFWNEALDNTHCPEFLSIEIYRAYSDFKYMMHLCERLFKNACKSIKWYGQILNFYQHKISLHNKFKRLTIFQACKKYLGINFKIKKVFNNIKNIALSLGCMIPIKMTNSYQILYEIFDQKCSHKIIQPTFVYLLPAIVSPLARRYQKNKSLSERAELFIAGIEFANLYSELNDSEEQKWNFLKDNKKAWDVSYIDALWLGMPHTSGLGIGIEWLCMLLLEEDHIKNVQSFPLNWTKYWWEKNIL